MMSAPKRLTGGCQCGRVRYRFEGEPGHAEACHCRMCQKAGGNWGLALVALAADCLVWTRGRPQEFRSSPAVARGFCDGCGTPLYMREDGDPHYEITVGSLDDPNATPPRRAVGVESRLQWFEGLADLPALSTGETRSSAELARLTSLQHPDSDSPFGTGLGASAEPAPWRSARGEDFDDLVEMNARLSAEDPGESTPFDGAMMRRTLAELQANPVRGAAAVLELGGRRCGYALLISFWSNELGGEVCAIDELYVEPDVRGRGWATQFIQALSKGDSPLWRRRTARIMIEAYRTNPRAKALYERLGFELSTNHVLTLGVARQGADAEGSAGHPGLTIPPEVAGNA